MKTIATISAMTSCSPPNGSAQERPPLLLPGVPSHDSWTSCCWEPHLHPPRGPPTGSRSCLPSNSSPALLQPASYPPKPPCLRPLRKRRNAPFVRVLHPSIHHRGLLTAFMTFFLLACSLLLDRWLGLGSCLPTQGRVPRWPTSSTITRKVEPPKPAKSGPRRPLHVSRRKPAPWQVMRCSLAFSFSALCSGALCQQLVLSV